APTPTTHGTLRGSPVRSSATGIGAAPIRLSISRICRVLRTIFERSLNAGGRVTGCHPRGNGRAVARRRRPADPADARADAGRRGLRRRGGGGRRRRAGG